MENFNWDNVSTEQQTYEPLTEGEYQVTVEKCEENISSKGNKCFDFTFAIANSKRKVFDTLYLTEKALNRFKKASGCMGVKLIGQKQPVASEYIGKQCIVYVTIEDYTNKSGQPAKRNNVDWWRSKEWIVGTEQIPF